MGNCSHLFCASAPPTSKKERVSGVPCLSPLSLRMRYMACRPKPALQSGARWGWTQPKFTKPSSVTGSLQMCVSINIYCKSRRAWVCYFSQIEIRQREPRALACGLNVCVRKREKRLLFWAIEWRKASITKELPRSRRLVGEGIWVGESSSVLDICSLGRLTAAAQIALT